MRRKGSSSALEGTRGGSERESDKENEKVEQVRRRRRESDCETEAGSVIIRLRIDF